MLLLIILIIVLVGVYFGVIKYASKLKAETEALALEVAREEGVQNDFMFGWKRFALIIDRNEKNVLLCERSGQWEFMRRDGCNYQFEVGNDGEALLITTSDFEGESRYLFKGTKAEINDLERKLNSVLHY
jgi:hypothetical protein